MAPTVTPTCFFRSDISQYRIVRSCVPPIGLPEPYFGVSDTYTRRNGQSVVQFRLVHVAISRGWSSCPLVHLSPHVHLDFTVGSPPSRQAKRSISSDSPGSPVIISNVRNASSRSTCCEVISLCYKSPHYFNSNSEVRIPLHIPLTSTHAPKFDHRYQTPRTNRMYRRNFPLLGNTSCWSGSS